MGAWSRQWQWGWRRSRHNGGEEKEVKPAGRDGPLKVGCGVERGLSAGALHLNQDRTGGAGLGPKNSLSSSASGLFRVMPPHKWDDVLSAFMATKEVPFHYYPEMSQFQLPSIYTQEITADHRILEGNVFT